MIAEKSRELFLLPVFPNSIEARNQQLYTSPGVPVNQTSRNSCCRCQRSRHQSDSIILGSRTQELAAGQPGQVLPAGLGSWAAGGSRPAASFLTPFPSLTLAGMRTTVLVWGKGRLRSMNMRLQVELGLILLFHSMSQQVRVTGCIVDALLGFKEKAQESCTDTLCFSLLERCITVSSTDGTPFFLFFLLRLPVFFLHCAQASASGGAPRLHSAARPQPGLSGATALLGPTMRFGSPRTQAPLPSGAGRCKPGHWLWVSDAHRRGVLTGRGCPPKRGAHPRGVPMGGGCFLQGLQE